EQVLVAEVAQDVDFVSHWRAVGCRGDEAATATAATTAGADQGEQREDGREDDLDERRGRPSLELEDILEHEVRQAARVAAQEERHIDGTVRQTCARRADRDGVFVDARVTGDDRAFEVSEAVVEDTEVDGIEVSEAAHWRGDGEVTG